MLLLLLPALSLTIRQVVNRGELPELFEQQQVVLGPVVLQDRRHLLPLLLLLLCVNPHPDAVTWASLAPAADGHSGIIRGGLLLQLRLGFSATTAGPFFLNLAPPCTATCASAVDGHRCVPAADIARAPACKLHGACRCMAGAAMSSLAQKHPDQWVVPGWHFCCCSTLRTCQGHSGGCLLDGCRRFDTVAVQPVKESEADAGNVFMLLLMVLLLWGAGAARTSTGVAWNGYGLNALLLDAIVVMLAFVGWTGPALHCI